MVYISNMLTIYSIIPLFLCFSLKAQVIIDSLCTLLIIPPIKQLTGYSYWKTIWRIVAAFIPFFGLIFALSIVGYGILYLYALIKFS